MTRQPRWIKKTIDAAENCNVQMPWERGARRQAMIANRLDREERSFKVTLPPMPEWLAEGLSA